MNAGMQYAARVSGVVLMLMGAASCGDVARTGRAPAYLVIDTLQAASGAQESEFGSVLLSDVVTIVDQTVGGTQVQVPTIFNDFGQVTLRVLLKDQGNPGSVAGPSNTNFIKLMRYRVTYRRTDGRNTPGVDVPYPFDGGLTATITNQPVEIGFELVRHQAKMEPPLLALASQQRNGAIFISTIAEITFYGEDLAGNDVLTTGNISINFGNFGDPQ
jgi:hypothetical protein